MPVGQSPTTTQVYSASIVTSDPSSGKVEAVLPGALRPVKVLGTPVAFRWPIPGEVWRIININGTFFLDCPLPIQENSSTAAMQPSNTNVTTINDIAPGDAVINAPTGKVWVMGSQDGSTDWNFDGQVGGDVSGPLDDLTVNTVKGGKTPLTANQNLADVASKSAALSNLGLFTSKWLFSDWTAPISVPNGSGTAYLCGWPTFTTGTTSEVWVFFAVCNAQANSANWTPMSCWFNTTWGNSMPSYQTGNTAAQTSDNSYWTIPCLYAVTIPANASGAVNFIGQGPSPFGWYAYNGYAFGLRVG